MTSHATAEHTKKEPTTHDRVATLRDDVDQLQRHDGQRPAVVPEPITTAEARELAKQYGGHHLAPVILDLCDQLDQAKPPENEEHTHSHATKSTR